MDPRLNDSETALQERARRAAASIKEAAATIDRDGVGSRSIISDLGDAGLLAACIPAEFGGVAEGPADSALVCEELGAASASVAAAAISHLAASFLAGAVASESERRELLPELLSGARAAALVLDGGGSLLETPSVSVDVAEGEADGGLSGVARAVAGAVDADVLVIPAMSDAGVRVFVLASDGDGIEVGREQKKLGLNGSGLATVTITNAMGATALPGAAGDALEAAADFVRIGLAAACAGVGRAALEASKAYVGEAEDGLDRAQSVQWMLADMATETEAGRLLTWYAASRQSAGERREAASMARLIAADAAMSASRHAVQILGPGGNDESAGVERLYRDAKAMEVHHGAVESQRREVARQLLPDLFAGANDA
jgi:alkylation response protein AidB-like acyl-CoA dehydrogenase